MTATQASSNRGALAASVRLRVAVFDRRCAEMQADTETAKAALIDVDRGTLRRWRRGEFAPQLEVAIRIARRLDLKVEDLWEEVPTS